jgi:two-component system sensor histidine kinase PilS (NtrC family)
MTRTLNLIPGEAVAAAGPAAVSQRLMAVHGLRSGLLVAVFLLALIFQLLQGEFFSPGIWMPVYAVLIVSFSVSSAYFLFPEWCESRGWVHGMLFALDALAVTLLVHHTGSSQSIFFFLYLVNIILAGLVFQKRGAFTQALWTSLLFGLLLLSSPQAGRENIFFLATLNNLAFFSVAYLSGNLSEQINFMGAQLKQTVRSLEILQDLNKLIVENIGTGIMTVDIDGRVVSANPAAETILDGLKLVGHDVNAIFPGLQLAGNVVSLHGKAEDVRQADVEFLNRHRDRLQIEVIVSPLKDDGGEAKGFVILFQDRTEVKRLEQAMRQKEKMAAVGQLAAGIAHEIRNPLASLSGSVQLMSAQPEKYSAEDFKLMRIITREIDRLNDLITEFLEYVRPEAPPTEKVDVNKVLREVLEIVRFNQQMNKDVLQEVQLKAQSKIFGHHDKLKQAFLNIIINAYQAMDRSQAQKIHIETFDSENRVVVVIKDTGSGMDEATVSRVFEPFFTTKAKGTGLGLAVTHKIFETHDARVNVTSKLGEGTTFTIDFPGERETYDRDVPKLKEA